MNPNLNSLQAYPFEKLAQLKAGLTPPAERAAINLAIGEPKHAPPAFVGEELIKHLSGLGQYPATKGSPALRSTMAQWLEQRFQLNADSVNPEQHILPVNGTREALFAFAQCVIDSRQAAQVMMPNPFYQIYEGAALLAGAQPHYLNSSDAQNGLADYSAVKPADWQRCQLLYLCSPGNPTGAVIDKSTLQSLINLAEQYDFIIASDECYSEIYPDENQPPVGLLQAAAEMGNSAFKRCIVFHSLSKRSNLPGLRSGFVAGDSTIIQQFLLYRTYHGCSMPPFTQAASVKAWGDEQHVIANRALYQQKFTAVVDILASTLNIKQPDAGFYLWPLLPVSDTLFAQKCFSEYNVNVLPGSYLSRSADGINPGKDHIRIALVAPLADCIEAAQNMCSLIKSL